jgi:outer membrane protein assembly factor BamB
MNSLKQLVFHAVLLSLGTQPIWAAESWTRFRGPAGDGHADVDSAPVHWSDSDNVVWKVEIPGEGWSSPVVADDRIYLTAAVPVQAGSKDQSLRLLAIDANNGSPVDQVEVFRQDGEDAQNIHGKNSHASPTPWIDGERIYVHFGHQGTACLDTRGNIIWTNTKLRYEAVHGNGGSPIVVDEALIFSCDGRESPFVVALDKERGRQLWKIPRQSDAEKKFSFSTPTLIEVDGRPQVITPGSNVVNALDPQTGREIWRVRYDGYSVIPKPVYGDGLLFLSTSYNSPSILAIRVDGKGDVTDTHVAWRTGRGAPHTPSPLFADGYLYTVSDDGIASCFDASTGERQWQERLGGNFSASPVLASGKVYFLSEDGQTTVVDASPRFNKRAENALNARTLASFGVIENDFLIRTDRHLYRIGS